MSLNLNRRNVEMNSWGQYFCQYTPSETVNFEEKKNLKQYKIFYIKKAQIL